MNRSIFILLAAIVLGFLLPLGVAGGFPGKQDIAITDLVISNNANRSLMVDDWTHIQCRWSRTGTRAFSVRISIDGRTVHEQAIPGNDSRAGAVDYRWKALAGQHTITARVFRANFKKKKSITVMVSNPWPEASHAQLPDLLPVTVQWKALDKQNQTVSLEVTVRNQGSTDYDGTKSDVEILVQNPRNPTNKSTAWASLETRLRPGQSTVVKQTFLNMVGEHNVFIHVDSHKKVRELNENNNKLEKLNLIIPAVWPGPKK